MNWDQIESKWAAMTRRVRADWTSDTPDAITKSVRGAPDPEVTASGLADRKTGTVTGVSQKTFNE